MTVSLQYSLSHLQSSCWWDLFPWQLQSCVPPLLKSASAHPCMTSGHPARFPHERMQQLLIPHYQQCQVKSILPGHPQNIIGHQPMRHSMEGGYWLMQPLSTIVHRYVSKYNSTCIKFEKVSTNVGLVHRLMHDIKLQYQQWFQRTYPTSIKIVIPVKHWYLVSITRWCNLCIPDLLLGSVSS